VAELPRHHCLPREFVTELAAGGLLIQALPNGSAKELSATVWLEDLRLRAVPIEHAASAYA